MATEQRIEDFGTFVNILPSKDGRGHISEIAPEYVATVRDYLSEGSGGGCESAGY